VRGIVEKGTGKRANVNIVKNMRPYDNDSWVSRNFSARQYGWEPRVSLETSIKNMVKEANKYA
jgi:nucleoside-diphosphate-sugar epimerase